MIKEDKLLPFRDYDEHEVVNLFALDGVGKAGTLVKVSAFDPLQDMFSYGAVGYQHDGVTTYRFVNKNKVLPPTSGDTKYDILGVTLYDVKEVDEHGRQLVYNRKIAEQKEIVISGETVPVLRRGLITLTSSGYVGTPAIGSVGVASFDGVGKIQVLDPDTSMYLTGTTAQGAVGHNAIVGKFISSTGIEHNGYAFFLLDL